MTDDLIERVARAIYLADEGLVSEEVDRYWNGWTKEARAALAIAFEEAAKICAAETDRVNAIWRKGNKADSHLEGVSDGWDCAYVEFYKRAKEFEVKP